MLLSWKPQKLETEEERTRAGRKTVRTGKKSLNMKLDILKEEYRKLADEKNSSSAKNSIMHGKSRSVNKKRAEDTYESESTLTMKPEIFFRGVGNELMLKKRYKDLIKIYPGQCGGRYQNRSEINKEYEKMKQLFL